MVWHYILISIWVFFPAAVANATPPTIARFTDRWTYPLDFYKTYKGKRILGDHKTIRGLLSGMFMGQLAFILQSVVISDGLVLDVGVYADAPWFYGLYIGFFALFGDAVKSFLKRRFNVAPGVSWFPFDQIDWLVFSLLGYWLLFHEIKPLLVIVTLVFGLIVHLLARFIPFLLGFDENPI